MKDSRGARRTLYYTVLLSVLGVLAYANVTAQTPVTNWKVKTTEHFSIFYEAASPAERDLKMLAQLLEKYYAEASEMFDVEIPKKIQYYFHSRPLYSGTTPVWGYATPESIHAAYSSSQKDSSPHELYHFIHNYANANAPYFFNEGACGFGIQIGGEDFHEKTRKRCKELPSYSLDMLVKDFKRYGRFGDFMAYSFNAYLIETFGKDKYGQFYKKVTQQNWQDVLREVYELDHAALEAQWKDFLCNRDNQELATKERGEQ
ncbi:hypothetical protein ACFL1E_07875 [Candidatus Omnitrophota bacterium]